jgi:hypothetical protein
MTDSMVDLIEAKSIPEPNSGCWLWMGQINTRGYGKIYHRGPADGKYPILFLTGISFAHSAEEQERWQSLHDRAVSRLMASLAKHKKPEYPKSAIVSAFINHNPFSS